MVIGNPLNRCKFVGNKANGRFSRWVLQENKAHQIFKKNEHFLPPDTHTHTCVSEGKNCLFFGKSGVLCFLATTVLKFAHLPYYRRIGSVMGKPDLTTTNTNDFIGNTDSLCAGLKYKVCRYVSLLDIESDSEIEIIDNGENNDTENNRNRVRFYLPFSLVF